MNGAVIFIISLVIAVILVIYVACCCDIYSYSSGAYTISGVLLWFFIIWWFILLICGLFDSEKSKKGETFKKWNSRKHNQVTELYATGDAPTSVQLNVSKYLFDQPAVLRIKLDGNETPANPGAFVNPIAQGYSETFNILVPPKTKGDINATDLFTWTSSANATVLDVKWIGNFDDILVSVKPTTGVKFMGRIDYQVIVNGVIQNMKVGDWSAGRQVVESQATDLYPVKSL